MGFGDRVELGAGICELANDGAVRKGLPKVAEFRLQLASDLAKCNDKTVILLVLSPY